METEFAILHWFQTWHNPVLDKIMMAITRLGDKGIFWIIVTLLMFIFLKKSKKPAWTSFVALAFSVIIVNLFLKNLVARDRPFWIDKSVELLVKAPDDFSFPSGHSSASFSSAVAIFMYYKKPGIAAIILAILIALSRMYLFVHFPTDVLAGTVIGIVDAIAAYYLVNFIYKKFDIENRKLGKA